MPELKFELVDRFAGNGSARARYHTFHLRCNVNTSDTSKWNGKFDPMSDMLLRVLLKYRKGDKVLFAMLHPTNFLAICENLV